MSSTTDLQDHADLAPPAMPSDAKARNRDAPAAAIEARIGRVVAVSGAQVVILLENRETAIPDGWTLQIGALVRMRTPASVVYGVVGGLSIPIPAQGPGDDEMKIVEAELVGEAVIDGDGNLCPFKRGVSVYPALGDGVFQTSHDDLRQVYMRSNVATARIGTIHQDHSLPAYVSTDDLLGKHFAVLGTTGTGKSCAVAVILNAILAHHGNGHVVLLDLHGEYAKAFPGIAELVDPNTLELPYWLLNFEEIVEIVINSRGPDRDVEAAILGDAILAAKRRFPGAADRAENMTVDTPVPYRVSDVVRLLDEAMGKLDKPQASVPYIRVKTRLAALQADRRFSFMFPAGLSLRDNMAAILSRLLRIPVAGKPLTIIDLSGVPSEILNVAVSLLCRMIFDFALWSEHNLPILLVCEEAHRYMPQDTNLGFHPTKAALSRIAKEGRKYGVSLCLVSQRPSELASTILSQCNTIFALRMNNQKDQEFVRGAMAESASGLLDFLPSLRNGEAIVVGEGLQVPVRLSFDPLPEDRRPRSATATFSAAWQQDHDSPGVVEQIIERWRHQRR